MSDFQAIGGVSETLRVLLEDRMEIPSVAVANFRVSIGPPRPETPINQDVAENPRVNLFLYRVLENGSLKNQEIPGHGSPGAYGFPPLSLDLHYLVTAYGTTEVQAHFNETLAHFLLGSAMRVLHDHAIIADELRTVRPPVGTPILHSSLLGEYEHVKLSLEPVNLDDISKLFTALTLPYRASAAYVVSVIQIESLLPRRFPRLVQPPPPAGPRVFVVPMSRPQILNLLVRWATDPPGTERPWPYARVNDTIILKGTHLDSTATRIRFGTLEIPVGMTQSSAIELQVPDDKLPDGTPIPADRWLQPGAVTVEVGTGIKELPSVGFPSNQAVFMLVPQVKTLTPNLVAVPRTLQIDGTRLFSATLAGETVVGRAVIPKQLYRAATPKQIQLELPDTLVAWPVDSLVSAPLAPFPVLPNNPTLQMTIAGDGPHTVRLPRKPTDIVDAASLLEAAIRVAQGGQGGFTGARVTSTSDARLVIVPGGLSRPVGVASDAISAQLKLDGPSGATTPQVYLSGSLDPFPVMAHAKPGMRLTVGGVTHDITIPTRPASLDEAAPLLEAAVNAFPEAAFAKGRFAVLDDQLLFLPGAAGAVVFDKIPAVDDASVVELGLFSDTLVRVRVNGSESLDQLFVKLTQ